MRFSQHVLLFAAWTVAAKALPQFGNFGDNDNNFNNFDNQDGGDGGDGATQAALAADAVATGSALTGQEDGTAGIKDGQAPSATDTANFINFCEGKTLTNGAQNIEGSCNGIPMGDIPAKTNMISTIITSPRFGQTFQQNESFTIQVQTQHLEAGSFTNPTTTYYSAPQTLNDNGDIIGHAHVTVQNIGSLNPDTPPDPTTFDFFLGIDDAGNGQGLLSADVSLGLLAGTYRVCTILSASNHQAVNMPVAQRGAQDDCVRFSVLNGGGAGGGGGNNGTATR